MISLRKIQGKIAQKIYEAPLGSSFLFGYHLARSAVYHAESLPLIHVDLFLREKRLRLSEDERVDLELLSKEVRNLYQEEINNIEAGYYNAESIMFENPIEHIKNLNKVFYDGLKVSFRRKNKKTKDFSDQTLKSKDFDSYPDYYKRNFHFQTDGYFSEESAEIYNHQVEILFRGTAGAMRRMVLPPLSKHFNLSKNRPVRIFEAGCGNGVSTYAVANKFKKVQITATDLSKDYIKYAREYNNDLQNVQWSSADATNLKDFDESLFDAWFSVFMFHELPRTERINALKEAFRVLKPGGVISIVDSLQQKDNTEFDFLLDRFPQSFHEPYYKNYILHPLEDMLKEVGFESINKSTGFMSKVVSAIKPE